MNAISDLILPFLLIIIIIIIIIYFFVYAQVLNIRRQKNEKSREYHTDLEVQAQERYEHRKQSQEDQRVKSVEVRYVTVTLWKYSDSQLSIFGDTTRFQAILPNRLNWNGSFLYTD